MLLPHSFRIIVFFDLFFSPFRLVDIKWWAKFISASWRRHYNASYVHDNNKLYRIESDDVGEGEIERPAIGNFEELEVCACVWIVVSSFGDHMCMRQDKLICIWTRWYTYMCLYAFVCKKCQSNRFVSVCFHQVCAVHTRDRKKIYQTLL